MTTSQIRKFLSAVSSVSNKIEAENKLSTEMSNEIQMLRVRLAYQKGRDDGRDKPVEWLYSALEKEIIAVKDKQSWKTFANYVEAIVAYHRFFGGK